MQWDAIWRRARADLVITTGHGDEDVFLWEHSSRVAQNVRRIAKLPEVREASPDEVVITSAALYHDADWVARVQNREVGREEILLRARSESRREEAALILERSLAKLLPRDSLTRASEAIRTLHAHDVSSIECQVVAEADNLDELGPLSLWLAIRRGVIEGKGVQAVIETWQRRKEFRYWDALLNDSFRFPAVRAIAKKRLEHLERLMKELELQHQGADLVFAAEPDPGHRTTPSTAR